jgi:hypothetical protein
MVDQALEGAASLTEAVILVTAVEMVVIHIVLAAAALEQVGIAVMAVMLLLLLLPLDQAAVEVAAFISLVVEA